MGGDGTGSGEKESCLSRSPHSCYRVCVPFVQRALESSLIKANERLAELLPLPRSGGSDPASAAAPSLPMGADDSATFSLLVQQLEERVRVATAEGAAAVHALTKAEAGAKKEQAAMRLEIQVRDAEIQLLHTKRREQKKDMVSTQVKTVGWGERKDCCYRAHSLSGVNFAIRV